MRTFLLTTLLILAIGVTMVSGDVPNKMSFQGILTDNAGDPLPDGNYTLTFRLYTVLSGGTPAWEETQQVPVFGGVFSALLGDVEALDLDFDDPYWVGVSINGGTELVPRTELTTSAYSFNVPDSIVTGGKLADATVVRSLNGLTDDIALTSSGGAVLSQNGNSINIHAGSAGQSSPWNQSGSNIYFNTGKVGIGDNSPIATLTVGNGDKVQMHGSDGDIVLKDDQGSIRFAASNGSNAPMIHMFPSGTNNSTRMVIAHSPNFSAWGIQYNDTADAFNFIGDNQPIMQVQLSGQQRVGIGTFSPQGKVHVLGNTSTGFGHLKLTENQFDYSRITMNNTIHNNFWDVAARTDTNLANAQFNIYHSSVGDIFSVNARGRIGINDASPSYAMEINGKQSSRIINAYNNLATTTSTTYNYGIRCNLSQSGNSGFPRLYNVYGISTDNDSYLTYGLYGYASGASSNNYGVYAYAPTASGYAGYFNGNTYATGSYQTSDAMFKTNVQDLYSGLDVVMELRPVSSYYDQANYPEMSLPEGEQFGFLAHELKAVMPNLVKTVFQPYEEAKSDTEAGQGFEFEAVNYVGLIPVLVSAMQEQQKQIDELKQEIEYLKSRR